MKAFKLFSKFSTFVPPVIMSKTSPHLTQVILNRPSALNALNHEMISHLDTLVSQKPEQKVLWFNGSGEKAFCSGGDLKDLWTSKQSGDPEKLSLQDRFIRDEYTLDYKISTMNPIQISVFDGIVMGGGVGISIYSKFKLTTEKSLFAMPEAKIGFFTDVSSAFFMSRLKNNMGLYLGLTGQRLRAKEMVEVGLATHFVQRKNLAALKEEVFESVDQNSNEESVRKIIAKYSEEVNGEYKFMEMIKKLFRGDTLKQIYSNLENDIEFPEFSKETLKMMKEQCPFSLRVIFESLKRGESMNLRDCLKMEFRLSQRFTQDTDFYEGIRCALINKSDKPNWRHESPFDVEEREVQQYFQPLSENLELKI